MGVRLLVALVDRLPDGLDPASRLVLVLLAEKANDQTGRVIAGRTDHGACVACELLASSCGDSGSPCCPDCEHPTETPRETLRRRSGLSDAGLTKALRRLAASGLEVRVPLAIDNHGRPVYAVRGRSSDFQIPDVLHGERVDDRPAISEKVGPGSTLPVTTVHPFDWERVDESPPPSLSPSDSPSADGWTVVHPSDVAVDLASRVACSTSVAQTALDNLMAAKRIDNIAGYVSRFSREDVDRWARASSSVPGTGRTPRVSARSARYCPEGHIVAADGSCCDACAAGVTVRPQGESREVAS